MQRSARAAAAGALALAWLACQSPPDAPGDRAASELVAIVLTPHYGLSLPPGAEVHGMDGKLLATLGGREDAAALESVVRGEVAADREVVLLPTPDAPHRRIRIGWLRGPDTAAYVRNINAMSRLEYLMHQSVMKQAFLGQLAHQPGRHAAESSAVTFHDAYRATLYFSMSLTEQVASRLVFDVFREDTMYHAVFEWSQPSVARRDVLMERLVDSIAVSAPGETLTRSE